MPCGHVILKQKTITITKAQGVTFMTKRLFTVIIQRDADDILIATVPGLQGCHTQAKTLPTLLSRIKEAISLCCEVEKDNLPQAKFVGMQEVEVAV